MSESDLNTKQSAPAPTSGPTPPRRKKSMFDDPVVRVLMGVVIGLVALYLATIVGALLMGVLGSTEPKSKVEHDLQYYEGLAAQKSKDPAVVHQYLLVLMSDKQYRKAQSLIETASKRVDQTATQDILTAQAELYYAQKKFDDAIKTSDEVIKKLDAYYKKQKSNTGSDEAKGKEISPNYWQAVFIKGNSESSLGKKEEAIATFTKYLKQNTTDSDVLILRGNLRLETGDKKGAEADFKKALMFIPDDPAALAGLKKIGAK